VQRRRGAAWSLPWWLRWRWPCRHRRAVIGCGPASAAPQGGNLRCPSGSSSWACARGCPNACYAVRRPVRCPGVRVSGLRVSGLRGVRSAGCPVCGRPVSASRVRRLVSALSTPGLVRGASVRWGSLPRGWDGRWRGHPPCPRAARLSARAGRGGRRRRSCWAGESAAELAAVWDALRRRLHPGPTAWPTRDSRLRARVARRVVEITGAGYAGCSPTWSMAVRRLSCVSSGQESPA
jgi:hypothetical protein